MIAPRPGHALPLALLVLFAPTAGAQGTKADYARADGLRESTRGKVVGLQFRPHWLADGTRFWYRIDGRDGARTNLLVDATKGTRKPAFDHARLAEALGKTLGTPQKPNRLAIDNLAFREAGAVDVLVEGKTWRFAEEDGSPQGPRSRCRPWAGSASRRSAADGRRTAPRTGRPAATCRRTRSGRPSSATRTSTSKRRTSRTPSRSHSRGTAPRDNGYERGVFWSPDSKHFVALRTERGEDHTVYLIESTPKGQLQPRLHSLDYRKPGDKVPITRPHLFDVASKKEVPIRDDLFANP